MESSLISQRKVTLYGVRAREIPETNNEREIRKELRALFTEVFGGALDPDHESSERSFNMHFQVFHARIMYTQLCFGQIVVSFFRLLGMNK